MMPRALKALAPSAAVALILLTTCGAQGPIGQESSVMTQLSQSFQRVVTKVSAATVTLDVVAYVRPEEDDNSSNSAPHDRQQLSKAHTIGSGVIVDTNGYIITNAHVVEGARIVRVTLDETLRSSHSHMVGNLTSTTFDARVVGVFEEADLALVKIDEGGLPNIPFANSDEVRAGQLVFAVGSPEGFKNSVSMGVVSAVGRYSESNEGSSFIQTDVAISHGSSGGALVDANGDLVGIICFMVTVHDANQRLGFALPSKLVRSVSEELKASGRVTYGDIGFKVQNVTPILARGLHLSQEWGMIVSDVSPGSSADKAGLEVQDLVLAMDGQPLASVPQFIASLYGRHSGSRVHLDLLRGSRHLALTVSVAERLPDAETLPDPAGLERGLIPRLGVVCTPVDQHRFTSRNRLRSSSGVVVVARLSGTDVDAELRSGDVIRSLNGTAVTSVEALRSAIDKLSPGASAVLQIERLHHFEYLPLEID
jgi:serine protease Do